MNRINKKIAAAGIALIAGITLAALTAVSQYADEKQVETLDSVGINGGTISFTYTIESKCPARSHDSSIEVKEQKSNGVVEGFTVKIFDAAYESECKGEKTSVTVSGSANLKRAVDAKLKELQKAGARIGANLTYKLPPLNMAALENAGDDEDKDTSGGTKKTMLPVMVDVTVVEYTPIWKCTLWKNDGAKKDGFEGTGSTIDEARRDAAQGCKRTNNPRCDEYSQSPEHTNCQADLQETSKVVQMDSNKLPAGTQLASWDCTLNKKDGARDDGFVGTGKTEMEAREDAAAKCARTNNPKCDLFASDDTHTACAPKMAFYGPKPYAQWKCTLWKNDGARKDGFEGTGATEAEARQDTILGCKRTNNPYCVQYSKDPKHTPCGVEFVYLVQ